MPVRRLSVFLPLLLLLSACVTVNIYFPAAAAEKAADRIIKEVWGEEGEGAGKPAAQPAGAPTSDAGHRPTAPSTAHDTTRMLMVGVHHVLMAMVAPAQAAADINVSTPAIATIKARMAGRHNQLKPLYASGALGLTREALVALRDKGAVPLNLRAKANKWVADENRDRNALYAEIARANGHPEWEQQIRDTFARQWVKNASSGWYYQDAAGTWKQR
ncbi:MAG: YdbL family protein [Gammaproteobacteria bacterium]